MLCLLYLCRQCGGVCTSIRAGVPPGQARSTYRAVPVHSADQRLLPVSWEGAVYIDKAHPIGFCLAPKLFSVLTDVMMWVLQERRVVVALHYLDDFLMLGPPASLPVGRHCHPHQSCVRSWGSLSPRKKCRAQQQH